jgi:hypothetical protein
LQISAAALYLVTTLSSERSSSCSSCSDMFAYRVEQKS